MTWIPFRQAATATATAVAATGVALSVGAWTDEPAGPAASAAAVVSGGAATREEARVAREHRADAAKAAARRAAAQKAAAQKAAAQKAAAQKAAAQKAAAQKAAAQKAARNRAAAERAAEDRASRSSPRSASPRDVARSMLADHGWSSGQFACLDSLWQKESGWDHTAENPSSGAYGIPQSLPASKMASAGSDWQSNPATQIRWGLSYIADRYGSPCAAWEHSQANNWY